MEAKQHSFTAAILILALSILAGWGHPAYTSHKTVLL